MYRNQKFQAIRKSTGQLVKSKHKTPASFKYLRTVVVRRDDVLLEWTECEMVGHTTPNDNPYQLFNRHFDFI